MSGLLTLDNHAATNSLRDTRKSLPANDGWSPRRRVVALVACVVASWLLVIGPILIWG